MSYTVPVLKSKQLQLISWKDAQNKRASAWCLSPRECDSARKSRASPLCNSTLFYCRILGHQNFPWIIIKLCLRRWPVFISPCRGEKKKEGKGRRDGVKEDLRERDQSGPNEPAPFVPTPKLFGVLFFFLFLLHSLGSEWQSRQPIRGHWKEKGFQWQLLHCSQGNNHLPGSGHNSPPPFYFFLLFFILPIAASSIKLLDLKLVSCRTSSTRINSHSGGWN